jgi:hypothetical protein
MGTGGHFSGGKARPGRDADHSPPSSAEVKYELELYLLSPHVPPWHVGGQLTSNKEKLSNYRMFTQYNKKHAFSTKGEKQNNYILLNTIHITM